MKKITLFFIAALFSNWFLFANTIYKKSAVASFYGKDFHGKQTSNGESFNMNDYTCAHKLLPFDTILKVTNLSNGKSVKVRVNDRGPFVVGREIDLSTAAAKKLDMINDGTVKVRLEIVELGPNTKLSQQTAASAKKIMANKGEILKDPLKAAPAKTTTTETTSKTTPEKTTAAPQKSQLWMIQVGAFSSKENATKRAKELSKAGFKSIFLQTTDNIVRVTLKNIEEENLEETKQKLIDNGFTEFTVKKQK